MVNECYIGINSISEKKSSALSSSSMALAAAAGRGSIPARPPNVSTCLRWGSLSSILFYLAPEAGCQPLSAFHHSLDDTVTGRP